jgi:FkbM family methyltransferase
MIRSDILQAPFVKEQIKQYLPENPRIIEAGAHIGRDTVKLSRLWPLGTLYAFEPVPALYEKLVDATKNLTNVICFPLALSDTTGMKLLHVSGGASTAASSLLEPYEYRHERPEVLFTQLHVPTITLDQWAADNRVPSIDFMWLDMQGYELKVIERSQLFSTVQCVLIEVSLTERFKGNPLYEPLLTWFETNGFKALQQDIPKHNKINILFKRI